MNVEAIMSRDLQLVRPNETLYDAAERMKQSDAGVMPVVSEQGDVLGVLTDRDIVVRAVAERADPRTTRVEDAMSRDPVTCRPDCPVEAAARTMSERQIRRLLVTEEHNRGVVGIVSLGDIAVRSGERELAGAAEQGVCEPT